VRGPSGCIFCQPEKTLLSDRERLILFRGRHIYVLLNRFPYAAGHLMVVPYGHQAKLHELEPAVREELMVRVAESAEILESVYSCDGLNVGANIGSAAGASFAEHLHFHLVPRWSGDVNFMTSIGEIRVIPTHLEHTYDRLLSAFRERAAR
jgi:ATP adenylyltransferase